jgi:hypothetical protein
MEYKRILWVLLAVGLITASGYGQSSKRVLFVGNSYTYFWNLHLQVRAMSQQHEGPELMTRASTSGGVNLGQHWRGERDLASRSLIGSGDYEVVILQDHSRRAIDAPDSLIHFGRLMAEQARESGAEVYYYVTWAREWDPYMQEPILEVYREAARQSNAGIIPVGPAWQRALALRPELDLYDPDGSHPSPVGTYLIACVMYGALTGESPVGLSERVALNDVDGLGYLFLNRMTAEDALFCQKVAQEILEKYR